MCEACIRTCWLLAPGSVCVCVRGGECRGVDERKKGGGRGGGREEVQIC